jgi:catechol 2,3-dioxygenase-like lactoylglutathione lyase family enzyme
MPAPFNVVGIDHIVLRAADPAALERFYLAALGLRFEKRQSELAQLRAGNALIDIVPPDKMKLLDHRFRGSNHTSASCRTTIHLDVG